MKEYLAIRKQEQILVIIAYFLIYIVWGSTYYFIGVALKGFPPFLLGGLRFSIAGLTLLSYCAMRGENIFKGGLIRKSAVSGIVLLFIDMAVVMLAQKYLSSSLVAILASSTIIWIMALDVPMWKVNFRTPAVGMGVMIGFLGVIFLFMEQLFENRENIHGEYGIALLMLGCISWSLGTLYTKYKSSTDEKGNDFSGAAWQMFFAGMVFWICSLAGKEENIITWEAIPATSWFALVYLITCGSILAYTSYIWLLKVRSAAEVGTHAYANPLVAVVLGSTLGGESVSWIQLTGLATILFSIFLIRKPSVNQARNIIS